MSLLTKAEALFEKYRPELVVAVGLLAQIPVSELHGTALDVVRVTLAVATVLGLRTANAAAAKRAAKKD